MTEYHSPLVTVILPVYNSEATLTRAINSVLSQTLRDIEILVVDDGSKDNTLLVAQSLTVIDERIQLIQLEKNGGKARAMNLAMSRARGKWIALIDADDCYRPARLETLLKAAEAHDVQLVADNQIHIDDATGDEVRQAFSAAGAGREIGMADFISHSDTGGTFDFGILKVMVRADFVRQSGLQYHPEARFSEDFYYLADFFSLGGRAWLVHEPLYVWTLPFSPSKRRWTGTGSGVWRYDYRNALITNSFFKSKLRGQAPQELLNLFDRRENEYQVMVHYLDAQRVFQDDRDPIKALKIIISHPNTWKLLFRRVKGRFMRSFIKKDI